MASIPRILAISGSTRSASFNSALVKIALEGARVAGAQATYLELRELPLPLYDGDLEAREGLPPNGRKLKDVFLAHDGLLIASPEYNSSFSGVLKNAIDWVSRPVAGQPALECFQNKVAGLLSASPGKLGGLRGLVHLRAVLGNIGVIVLPDQIAIPQAHEAFDPASGLKDAKLHQQVEQLGAKLTATILKLQS